jgi:hypothetical protein
MAGRELRFVTDLNWGSPHRKLCEETFLAAAGDLPLDTPGVILFVKELMDRRVGEILGKDRIGEVRWHVGGNTLATAWVRPVGLPTTIRQVVRALRLRNGPRVAVQNRLGSSGGINMAKDSGDKGKKINKSAVDGKIVKAAEAKKKK